MNHLLVVVKKWLVTQAKCRTARLLVMMKEVANNRTKVSDGLASSNDEEISIIQKPLQRFQKTHLLAVMRKPATLLLC